MRCAIELFDSFFMNADQILSLLEKQKFADWYNEGGDFDKYITGDLHCFTKDEILAQIREMFKCA